MVAGIKGAPLRGAIMIGAFTRPLKHILNFVSFVPFVVK